MAGTKVYVDYAGVGRVLRGSDMAAIVADAANTIASEMPAGTTVIVDRYTTDRAAASVTVIGDVAGDDELKYGTLENAAHAAGLDFTPGTS